MFLYDLQTEMEMSLLEFINFSLHDSPSVRAQRYFTYTTLLH